MPVTVVADFFYLLFFAMHPYFLASQNLFSDLYSIPWNWYLSLHPRLIPTTWHDLHDYSQDAIILAPLWNAWKSTQVHWLLQILHQVPNQAIAPWQWHYLLFFLLSSCSGSCYSGTSGMFFTFIASSQWSGTGLFCCHAWHQKIDLSTASQTETPV